MNHPHQESPHRRVSRVVLAGLVLSVTGCAPTGNAPATGPAHPAGPSSPGNTASAASPTSASALFLPIIVVGDAVTPQHKSYTLTVGDTVALRISSNHDDVIAIQHGPTLTVSANTTIPGRFTPTDPGTYQVRSKTPATLIATLHVHPTRN